MSDFLGFMIDNTNFNALIHDMNDEIQHICDYLPQTYPHTTLIYLGSNQLHYLTELMKQQEFYDDVKKILNANCIITDIDFIGNAIVFKYTFENNELNDIVKTIISKYEKTKHCPYCHVTLGLFCDKFEKNKFLKTDLLKHFKTKIKNLSFVLKTIDLIHVDNNKFYKNLGIVVQ